MSISKKDNPALMLIDFQKGFDNIEYWGGQRNNPYTSVTVYINNNPDPSLVVEKVTRHNTGLIGFYVADTSGGDFANLSITKTDKQTTTIR